MSWSGLLTVALVAIRFLAVLLWQLLLPILGLSGSVGVFVSVFQQQPGQLPYIQSLLFLIGWAFSALLWLLLAWFSGFSNWIASPAPILNSLRSVLSESRTSSNHG